MAYPDLTSRSLAELVSLTGRTAVVTGGAVGIGKAIATRLAEAGATVVIGDLNGEKAAETASTLPGVMA
jgi:NAD(P)-dependent dehydrogenase (short-subunit alcohol dehydrogenase family)